LRTKTTEFSFFSFRSVPQVLGLISQVILYQKSIIIYVDFNIALCNW
jgi:hypothetical protein